MLLLILLSVGVVIGLLSHSKSVPFSSTDSNNGEEEINYHDTDHNSDENQSREKGNSRFRGMISGFIIYGIVGFIVGLGLTLSSVVFVEFFVIILERICPSASETADSILFLYIPFTCAGIGALIGIVIGYVGSSAVENDNSGNDSPENTIYHYDENNVCTGSSEHVGNKTYHYDSEGVYLGSSEHAGNKTYHYDKNGDYLGETVK